MVLILGTVSYTHLFCLLLFTLPCLAVIWFGLFLARLGRSVDESEGWSQLESFWQDP